MDIGLPKESRGDGVVVKPLVSYLVVDLDGRINLNAHGNLTQLPGREQMRTIPLLPDVTESKRGQGYGRALMDKATEYAKSNDYQRLELSTAFDNVIGQKLYESLGYIKDNADEVQEMKTKQAGKILAIAGQ